MFLHIRIKKDTSEWLGEGILGHVCLYGESFAFFQNRINVCKYAKSLSELNFDTGPPVYTKKSTVQISRSKYLLPILDRGWLVGT